MTSSTESKRSVVISQNRDIVSHGKYTSLAALAHSRSDSGKPLCRAHLRSIHTPMPGNHPNYRRNDIKIRKETLITRRRQLCQDMGRMAELMAREALERIRNGDLCPKHFTERMREKIRRGKDD